MDNRPDRRPRLTIIGDVGVDLVMGPVNDWPQIGTEVIVDRSELRLGGSAGNAFLATRLLGADCRLISATGSDVFGTWLTAQVEAHGGTTACVEGPTSVSTGVIHGCGERSFFTTRGHLEHLRWEDLSTLLEDAVDGDIVLLTGAFLLPQLRRTYPTLLRELRLRGYRIAIDTGWPSKGWTQEVREEARGWLALCDYILLNNAEILALTDRADVDRALSALAASLHPDATLVVKAGSDGAVGFRHGVKCSAPAPDAVPFDTIGAGDCFNAGYLQACLAGHELEIALGAGCKTATQIISRFPRSEIQAGDIRI